MRDTLENDFEELKRLESEKIELEKDLKSVKDRIERTKITLGGKDISKLTKLLEKTTWVLDGEYCVQNRDKEIARATKYSKDGLGHAMENFLEGYFEEEIVADYSINTEEGVEFEIGAAPTIYFDCEDFGFDINDLTNLMHALDILASLKLNVTFSFSAKERMLVQLIEIRDGINRLIRIVRSGKFFRRNKRGK